MFLGISDAVFIFTTMLKFIQVYLSSKEIPSAIYIDNQFVLGKNEEECKANNSFAVEVLDKVGWVFSLSKSAGLAFRLTFLGLGICSVQQKFFIPEKKFVIILSLLEDALHSRKMQIRQLASLVGKLQSCCQVDDEESVQAHLSDS